MLPETHSYVSGSDVNSGPISLSVEKGTYSPKNLCHLPTDRDVKSLENVNSRTLQIKI